MMQANLWFIYAISASLCWGMGYVLSEKILKAGISPIMVMFAGLLISLPIYAAMAYFSGSSRESLQLLAADRGLLSLMVIATLITIGGNFFILMGIASKNATLASLIEITYPLFTFIFAWLILKDVQLNWGTALGGMLILSGIAVVYLKS